MYIDQLDFGSSCLSSGANILHLHEYVADPLACEVAISST